MLWPNPVWPNQALGGAEALPPVAMLFLLLLAPALGSFLGVLVDRLPRGEDVLWAPSRCRSCETRLQVRDLLPILSFIWTRGRCRHCAATIPPWSLYLEIMATGAVVLALAAGGSAGSVLLSCLFLWILLALASCDLLWLRLPDGLVLALAAVVHGMVQTVLQESRYGRSRDSLPLGVGLKVQDRLEGMAPDWPESLAAVALQALGREQKVVPLRMG